MTPEDFIREAIAAQSGPGKTEALAWFDRAVVALRKEEASLQRYEEHMRYLEAERAAGRCGDDDCDDCYPK